VIDLLKEGGDVIKLITLAPEVCDPELIGMIRDLGIRVSAGHSNATFRQGSDAFKHGVSLATHLFNAMSPLQHRDPGMVGAIFCADNAMASIIPDGHHVNWAALQIAKKQLGERLFVITDAVTDTSQGPYLHQLVNDHYEASGVLSGSSLTMLKALNNLIHFGAIEPEEALRMCSLYPARALGIDDKLGRLAPGYQAQWTALSFHEKNYTLTLL
jgi:N-acetylglucosamine-6-phosphate deacetylase